MELLLVISIVLSGGLGALAAVWFIRAQQAQAGDTQAAAVEAAVAAALRERQLTVDALSAEREATVQAAVDTVVKVAGSALDGKLQAGSRELGHHTNRFDQQVVEVKAELEKVNGLMQALQRDKAHQHGDMVDRLEQAAKPAPQDSAALFPTSSLC